MTTPTSNSCCEKCRCGFEDAKDKMCHDSQCECHQESKCCGGCSQIDRMVPPNEYCGDPKCECHTTEKNSGWREDIKDEGWYKSGVLDTWDEGEVRLLFSFITQVEKEAEERGYKAGQESMNQAIHEATSKLQ